MAEIHLVRHMELGQEMVLKRLLPETMNRPDLVELFLTEADVGSLLQHENVVQILDAGEADGEYFIAMEFVDGPDLHTVLALAAETLGPMPAAVAMRITLDALRGLHAAHVLVSPAGNPFGLVHRDISPDNLFLNREGVTKVADFGIAKLSNLEGLTATGMVKGKLAYMSPEQMRGDTLDGRSDAFSLALVTFEMLTGLRPQQPRAEENDMEAFMRIMRMRIPRVRRLEPEIPRKLAAVIDKALRKRLFWRHKTCAAFADSLEKAAGEAGHLATHNDVATYLAPLLSRQTG
jgi:serine/threonine-protein kinase